MNENPGPESFVVMDAVEWGEASQPGDFGVGYVDIEAGVVDVQLRTPRDRYVLAALLLDGTGFGFTDEDLAVVGFLGKMADDQSLNDRARASVVALARKVNALVRKNAEGVAK